jgi:IclR family pca regulon transcriptional regulator
VLESTEPRRKDVIEAVERALGVLQVFSDKHPALTLADTAKLANLSRGTTRRILITFEALGFVVRDGNRFLLTPRVLRLGYSYLSSLPIWDRAQPHMRQLADTLVESCSAATLDGDDIVYVARVPSQRNLSITLTVGSRLPAYATSLGHVLLAGLPAADLARYLKTAKLSPLTPRTITDPAKLAAELAKVRQRGFSLVDGEREEGVRSVAAPIRDRSGTVIAAINVSTSAGRVSIRDLRNRFAPEVMAAAKRISDELAVI